MLFLVAMISVICIATTAFDEIENKQPRSVITNRFLQRHERFLQSLTNLSTAARQLTKNPASTRTLQQKYLETRSTFKAWEYLAEYLDPMLVRDYVNGAPLPKLERNSFGLNILEPTGMQRLDELIFSEKPFEEKQAIEAEIEKLQRSLKEFSAATLLDRQIFEAIRLELVRVFTLGLTGFDVPASGNAIPDALLALETLQYDFSLYGDAIQATDSQLGTKVETLFRNAVLYLKKKNDFDKLDRIFFLKEFINPLFAATLRAQQQLGIELLHEVTEQHLIPPINHLSTNIFDNHFLDPAKYMQLAEQLNTPQLVSLGKTLFFDPILSKTNERSCASCHSPKKAFTDGIAKSIAMGQDGTVERNAPTLINAVYSDRYFADMRADALEEQVEHVIVNKKEFATEIFEITSKLSQSEEYVAMFRNAFQLIPGNKITKQTISYAIAAYVASLRGFNSPFDQYIRNETANIAPSVQRGFNLFMGKASCGTCHFAPVFNGTVPPLYNESESEVLGVPENPYIKKPVLDGDQGRGKARLKEQVYFYQYSFKTPTVRNAALTAPYMHNGAYRTLEDLMDFYNKGGGQGIGIKLEHQTLPFDKLNLTKQEIMDIIAFMNALTDTTGMTDVPTSLPAFSMQPTWNTRKIGGNY